MKKCAHCGNDGRPMNLIGTWTVMCEDCGATGPIQDTKEEAIRAWDTRLKEEKEAQA